MNFPDSAKEKWCSFPSTAAPSHFGEWGDAELSSRHFFLELNWKNSCQSQTKKKKKNLAPGEIKYSSFVILLH